MFKKILVAVDGSSNSDRAVEAAAALAGAARTGLVICHAFHIPDHYRSDLADSLEDALREDAEDILDHASRVATAADVQAETRLLSKGHPAEAVLAFADEIQADLIVVGIRGRTPDTARSMGSVSSAVSSGASCSVLLVRKAAS